MSLITDLSNVVLQKHGDQWWAVSQKEYGKSPHYDIRDIRTAEVVDLPEHTDRVVAVLQLVAPGVSQEMGEFHVDGVGWINNYAIWNEHKDTYWVTAEYDPRRKV